MAKSSSDLIKDLYQTFLLRTPSGAEVNYYVERLDWGLVTRAGVALTFINASEYNPAAEEVTRLYMAAFNRIPDVGGLDFWLTVHRNGATHAQIADIFTRSPEFQTKYGENISTGAFIDLLYNNVLGREADASGKQYWSTLLDKGLTRGDLVNSFAQSAEHQQKSANKVLTALLYKSMAGREPTESELAAAPADREQLVAKVADAAGAAGSPAFVTYSSSLFQESASNDGTIANTLNVTVNGNTFKGAAGAALGKITNVPTGLTASLVKVNDTTATLTLKGAAKDHGLANSMSNLTVTLDDAAFTAGKASTVSGAVKSDIKVSFLDIPAVETGGTLKASGTLSSSLVVDLATDKLTINGAATSLVSGSMDKVRNVDFSELKPAATTGSSSTSKTVGTVSITGDALANSIAGAGYATTIEGGGGDDTIVCGGAKDTIVFAGLAANNGTDTITGFALGKGGDVLNFSAFLNKTGTANIRAVELEAGAMSPRTWASGDVLVAQGPVPSAAAVVALFGADRAFAAPTKAGKMVMITCDIVGDASIWYVVNQTDLANITVDEVTLVGTLKGVNNLAMVGFDAGNLA